MPRFQSTVQLRNLVPGFLDFQFPENVHSQNPILVETDISPKGYPPNAKPFGAPPFHQTVHIGRVEIPNLFCYKKMEFASERKLVFSWDKNSHLNGTRIWRMARDNPSTGDYIKNGGQDYATSYTPKGKDAEKVLERFYA